MCFLNFMTQKFWRFPKKQYLCTLFSGNENLTPKKRPRFSSVKVATSTPKTTKIDSNLDKIAAKIQKNALFSKKMQKNFGSSKISSTFAAGFAQKTTSGVKNDL